MYDVNDDKDLNNVPPPPPIIIVNGPYDDNDNDNTYDWGNLKDVPPENDD